jgi:hypothetical protein
VTLCPYCVCAHGPDSSRECGMLSTEFKSRERYASLPTECKNVYPRQYVLNPKPPYTVIEQRVLNTVTEQLLILLFLCCQREKERDHMCLASCRSVLFSCVCSSTIIRGHGLFLQQRVTVPVLWRTEKASDTFFHFLLLTSGRYAI